MDSKQKKPTVPEVIPLVRAWYALPGNGAGGMFHIIIDDGNYEQHFANSALKEARETGDPVAIELAEKLAAMSSTQRRKLRKTWYLKESKQNA